ncbi:unnamed protein product, partial [Prorocentrum cordatum]
EQLSWDTRSTAYSGIGAPEVAINCICQALGRKKKKIIHPPRFLYAIEWDEDAQKELQILLAPTGGCLFGDITQFFIPELQDQVLRPAIRNGGAVTSKGWCLVHKKYCYLKPARHHTAGTSCTAFSKQGPQTGIHHWTIVPLLAWIGLRLLLQEAEVEQENVEGFDLAILSEFLGDTYWIDSVLLDPRMFGWPSIRTRKWTKLTHKYKALPQISPLSRFCKRFYRLATYSWREYFFQHMFYGIVDSADLHRGAIDNELDTDLAWAQARPSSCMKGEAAVNARTPDAWFKTLSIWEKSNLLDYMKNYPNAAWQINQDANSHTTASTSTDLHTLIRNHIIFADSIGSYQAAGGETAESPRRWLSPTEALVSQGFPIHPVYPQRSQSDVLCSFNVRAERKHRVVAGQAGNTMNVSVAGVFALAGYCNLAFRENAMLTAIAMSMHVPKPIKDTRDKGQGTHS